MKNNSEIYKIMKQEIIDKIKLSNLNEKDKLDLIKSLTSRYLIQTQNTGISLGSSKFGGYPHLPKKFEYPQEETYFYEFVCQINLSELIDNDILNLPQKGILYFFIDDDFNVGNVNTKVFLLDVDNEELEIKLTPSNKKSRCESFDSRTIQTELRIRFIKTLAISQLISDTIVNTEAIDTEQFNLNFDIESYYSTDQIGGYPATWRNKDSEWWAYLVTKRYACLYYLTQEHQLNHLKKENINLSNWIKSRLEELIIEKKNLLDNNNKTSYIYHYWEQELADIEFTQQHFEVFIESLENHKKESEKWKQLLSISSMYDARIMFGDGRMEFFINSQDIEQNNFSNVFCQIYY